MRAVLVGSVETTRVALRSIAAAAGWSLAAIMTLPPALAARHSDFVDLTTDAASLGAALVHAADCNDPEALAAITNLAPDIVFVVGWSQICGPGFRAAAGGRVVGYHPAPLPRLRGRAAMPWTILLAEPITAGTLFWIDDGVDTGPILAQQYFHVGADETVGSLYRRHLEALAEMLARTLPALAANNAERRPQDERHATWAARRVSDDGAIDWSRPAADIVRLVRAVGRPYPGAFSILRDERLTIWSATAAERGYHDAASPGQVVAIHGIGFAVRAGCGGVVRVDEWQSASGRAPSLSSRMRAA